MANAFCAVCGKKVRTSEKGICCDGPCDRWFHSKCKNITEERYKTLASDSKLKWHCDRDDCVEAPNLKTVEANVNKLLDKFNEFEKERKDILQAVEHYSDQFDSWKKEIDSIINLKSSLTKILKDAETRAPQYYNEEVIAREEDQQRSRQNNIKIVGIPERPGEDLYKTFMDLASYLGEPLQPTDIDIIHRTSSFSKGSQKPIVVRLVCRWKKEAILHKLRSQKMRLKTTDLGLQGAPGPIFINDHLSPFNETLAKHARDLRKQNLIQFTWVRNAKVFVRVKEGEPVIRVQSMKDLDKLSGTVRRS